MGTSSVRRFIASDGRSIMTEIKHPLFELAQQLGIQIHYENAWGEVTTSSVATVIKTINALGIIIKDETEAAEILKRLLLEKISRKVDVVNVLWNGKGALSLYLTREELNASLHYEICLEDNSLIKNKINIAKNRGKKIQEGEIVYYEKVIKLPQLPFGYHHFTLYFQDKTFHSFLISAPTQLYTDNVLHRDKLYGLFAPIYALHDSQSLGCGDLGTFSRFAKWMAEKGASIVATMPFFSAFLQDPCEPSPYSPVSRLFWNELYLDLNTLASARPSSTENKEEKTIDITRIAALRRAIIENEMQQCFEQPVIKKEFDTYVNEHPELKAYALFRAQQELSHENWHLWPKGQQKGAIALDEALYPNYCYHLFVQWQFLIQLHALKKQINEQGQLLYLDLPIGVHRDGFDPWYYQDDFISEVSIGAPPDPVYRNGQNWEAPPLNPISLRKNNYAYLIALLRHVMPHVDLLRIDHVMGFNRLYWIPKSCQPHEGVYVQYPDEEIYAIFCLESHRHKTVLIGENLGTVPPCTNRMMKKHAMVPMHIVQYLLDSKETLIPQSKLMLASLNTHDMPTFYAYCNALDIKKKDESTHLSLDNYKKELAIRHKHINQLKRILKIKGYSHPSLIKSALQFLAQSKAHLLIINIEDLWGEASAQNTPCVINELNWRKKLAFSLEELALLPEVNDILRSVNDARRNKKSLTSPLKTANLISANDIYLFNEGRHFRLYEWLGAHPTMQKGREGIRFAVWAPNAKCVSVIGSFNSWVKDKDVMRMLEHSGIWELFIPEARIGDLYKFYIQSKYNGQESERSDPFSFYQEIAPKTASIVYHSTHEWQDGQWMKKRQQLQTIHAPISIYEVHIGSWRRVVEEDDRYLTYREMAPLLAEYVLAMNFTHVEFLPVMEHPFYGSWGYQTLGYFSPSSRYGTPDDFKFLIDYLHQHDIGVILDWVPSHFPNDWHGLAYFDGTYLYEHSDPKKGFHPDWKSAIFNYGRHEIKEFL